MSDDSRLAQWDELMGRHASMVGYLRDHHVYNPDEIAQFAAQAAELQPLEDAIAARVALVSRMAAYLKTVVSTKSGDDGAEVELLRDYWLLRATTDDERESVRRHFYQPCEHCPTYDDRLAVGRENDELHAQGKVRLVWPCCGAPLGFETVLEMCTSLDRTMARGASKCAGSCR